MAAPHGEQHFPKAADNKSHQIERQKVHEAIQHVVPDIRRVVSAQRGHNAAPPAVQRAAGKGQHVIRLQPDVVHAIKHGREGRKPHRDHDALQINTVSHMGVGAGDTAGRIKNRIDSLVERIPTLEPTSRLEVRFNGIQLLSQSHVSAFLLD